MKSLMAAVLVTLLAACMDGNQDINRTTPQDLREGGRDASNFELIGHNDLSGRELDGNTVARGMNAALAIFDHFVYVGNRTDSSSRCGRNDPRFANPATRDTCPHVHPGILVVDAKDPSHPKVVNEFLIPAARETTRELRVWPQKKLLVVLTFGCSTVIHACTNAVATPTPLYRFFDLKDPAHPRLVQTVVPRSAAGAVRTPHEFFLWVDPKDASRALIVESNPTISADPAIPNLIVRDISNVPATPPVVIAEGNWNDRFPGTDQANYPFDDTSRDGCGPYDCNLFVHSMGVKADGTRTYLALEAGHFLVLDTSFVFTRRPSGGVVSLNDKLLTDPRNRPVWLQNPLDPAAVPGVSPNDCARVVTNPDGSKQEKDCPNSHSAVQVPGRRLALTTDEVYGTFTFEAMGCRWGWMRLIDVRDPAHPAITGEFMIDQDRLSFCGSPEDTPESEFARSFSSHNPTVLRRLAILSWHSGGLRAIDISDERDPRQAGFFTPTPVARVATEDPALSGPLPPDQASQHTAFDDTTKLVFWSYPIIKDGLIYVIDVRNGLYILSYDGPHASEVDQIRFLEGNTNLGDAARLDRADKDED